MGLVQGFLKWQRIPDIMCKNRVPDECIEIESLTELQKSTTYKAG